MAIGTPVSRESGPNFVVWCCLWGLGAAVPIVSLAVDIIDPKFFKILGRDFANLYAAGRLVLEGDSWCAFDVDCFRIALMKHVGIVSLQNYSYPPHALLIAAPFGLLPYYPSLAVWTVLGSIFFMWSARPYLPKGFSPVLAVLTPAALLNIWNGHYGFLFGGLWLLAFTYIRGRPALAGVLAALMTFKPHLGLFVAILMATRVRAFATAVLGAILLVCISAALFGPSSWHAFVNATFSEQVVILNRTTGEFYFRMMPSAYVAYGPARGLPAQIFFALAAMAMLVRARSLDPFALATATFLVVPYVFNYDMTVACLGFATALWSRWASLELHEKVVLSFAFLSPQLTYVLPWLVPPILLAALWVQLKHNPTDWLSSQKKGAGVPPAPFPQSAVIPAQRQPIA